MIAAPLPADEQQRLAALRALLILDTPPEQRFDRIVAFAATEFDMPVVTISLVDADRQWFKSRLGLPQCETPRRASFCAHAILQAGVFVVEDARLDARFADSPLVTGTPPMRFYAGAPLQLPDGSRVGMLCLIDTRPRQLDDCDLAILGALRDLVVEELLAGVPAVA